MHPTHRASRCRLRRVGHLTSAAAIVGSALVLVVPTASAAGLSSGNLLVSTSVYDDLPNITVGSTVLPITPAAAVTVTGVTSSGTAPNVTATISTGTKKTGLIVGQYVTIAGV